MNWYKRALEPNEDFGSIFNEFEQVFVSLGSPDEMTLAIDERNGLAGALYATFTDDVTASKLGFTRCHSPPSKLTNTLIGRQRVERD